MNSLSSARGHPQAQPGRARLAVADRPKRPLLSLALQGGGSFGAFTWGVLDRLLREETFAFDMVSGASAGAINAVVLANGLAGGGPREAREQLDRFWRRVSDAGALTPFGMNVRTPLAAVLIGAGLLATLPLCARRTWQWSSPMPVETRYSNWPRPDPCSMLCCPTASTK